MDQLCREEVMLILNITEDDLVANKAKVIEKSFCAALCNQSTDIIQKVLKDFIEIRDTLYKKNSDT